MCLAPITVKGMQVGCGKCIECKIRKSNEWAFRITQESQLYDKNCMITLTYNDANLPTGKTLVLKDLQDFMKRLRKKLSPLKIRFFACGEYGDKGGRPHYHIIIFNYDFDDKYFYCLDNKKTKLFRSPILEKLWDKGFSSIGEVNQDSAKYCAIYLQKPPKDGRKRPFVVMSRRPGIGFDKITPNSIPSDKIYLNGKYIPIPKYYLETLDKQGFDTSALREKRRKRGEACFFESAEVRFNENIRRRKKFERIFEKRLDENSTV